MTAFLAPCEKQPQTRAENKIIIKYWNNPYKKYKRHKIQQAKHNEKQHDKN